MKPKRKPQAPSAAPIAPEWKPTPAELVTVSCSLAQLRDPKKSLVWLFAEADCLLKKAKLYLDDREAWVSLLPSEGLSLEELTAILNSETAPIGFPELIQRIERDGGPKTTEQKVTAWLRKGIRDPDEMDEYIRGYWNIVGDADDILRQLENSSYRGDFANFLARRYRAWRKESDRKQTEPGRKGRAKKRAEEKAAQQKTAERKAKADRGNRGRQGTP